MRYLVLNADDFGGSPGVNAAVADLHDRGIVTSASLLVAGAAAGEAVALARQRPSLAVGLHAALVQSPAVSTPEAAPRLVSPDGRLPHDPVRAGIRAALDRRWAAEARREIAGQVRCFAELGLGWDHVDSHVHVSLGPRVLDWILEECGRHPLLAVRVPEDDYALYRRLDPADARRQWAHALWFRMRCRSQRARLRARGYLVPERCFGFFRSGRLDLPYLERLVAALPEGLSELHCHPNLEMEAGRQEHAALSHPVFRNALEARGVRLVSYRALAEAGLLVREPERRDRGETAAGLAYSAAPDRRIR